MSVTNQYQPHLTISIAFGSFQCSLEGGMTRHEHHFSGTKCVEIECGHVYSTEKTKAPTFFGILLEISAGLFLQLVKSAKKRFRGEGAAFPSPW